MQSILLLETNIQGIFSSWKPLSCRFSMFIRKPVLFEVVSAGIKWPQACLKGFVDFSEFMNTITNHCGDIGSLECIYTAKEFLGQTCGTCNLELAWASPKCLLPYAFGNSAVDITLAFPEPRSVQLFSKVSNNLHTLHKSSQDCPVAYCIAECHAARASDTTPQHWMGKQHPYLPAWLLYSCVQQLLIQGTGQCLMASILTTIQSGKKYW